MPRHALLGLLAASLSLGSALPAFAEVGPARLENSLTSGGLNIAPRYLDKVGDVDLNLLAGVVTYPSTGGGTLGGQLGLQARIHDKVQLLANFGPLAEIGLRGPLWSNGMSDLGWDARFRSEVYFANDPGLGLAAPMLSLFPGASAQGGEIKLNAATRWNGFQLYATPLVSVMSNRTSLGLEGGLDWAIGRWGLGYSAAYRANVVTPFSQAGIQPSELQHGAGLRYSLDERTFLQANYYLLPADAYGTGNQMVLAGFGYRLFGADNRQDVRPAALKKPLSQAAPAPVPTSSPKSMVTSSQAPKSATTSAPGATSAAKSTVTSASGATAATKSAATSASGTMSAAKPAAISVSGAASAVTSAVTSDPANTAIAKSAVTSVSTETAAVKSAATPVPAATSAAEPAAAPVSVVTATAKSAATPTSAATAPASSVVLAATPGSVSILEGRLIHSLLSGLNPGKPLTVRLKRLSGKEFVKVDITAKTDATGRFVFRGLPKGDYQVFYKDEGLLTDTADVLVADSVKVAPGRVARVTMDLAWRDADFKETITVTQASFIWGRKPGAPDALYQGVLRGVRDGKTVDLLSFPLQPTTGLAGGFPLSSEIKTGKPYHFMKYWRKGGAFHGATYYGQSKPRDLTLPR